MTHPPEDLLIQYAVGAGREVADHVDVCEQCEINVKAIRELLETSPAAGAATREPDSCRIERERDRAAEILPMLTATGDDELRNRLMSTAELRTDGGLLELIEWLPGVRWSRPERALTASSAVVDIVDESPSDDSPLRCQIRVSALRELSSASRALGRYDQALEILEETESLANQLPISELEVARVWYERGRTHLELGECAEARRWAKKAAEGFGTFGDHRRKNRAMYMVAGSYFNEGSMRAAAERFLDLLEAFEEDHDEVSAACVSSALGHIYVREGRTSEAPRMFRRAISIFRNRGMSVDAMRAEWGLARVRIAENDFEAAVEQLRKLIQQFLSLKLVEEASLVRLDLYEALLLLDRRNEAESEVRESLSVLSGRFSRREQQRALAYLREISDLRQPRPEKVREVSHFLDLSRLNPGLEFIPGANRLEGGGSGTVARSLAPS